MFESRDQSFGEIQSALGVANIDRQLGGAFLSGLAFASNMINLLLKGAAVCYFPLKRGLICGRRAAQRGRLGLGSSQLVAKGIVGGARGHQLPRQGFDQGLQWRYSGGDGLGKQVSIRRSRINRLFAPRCLLRADGKYFGRDVYFRLQTVVPDPPRPFGAPGPGGGGAGAA